MYRVIFSLICNFPNFMFIENLDKNKIRNTKLHTVWLNRNIASTNRNNQRKNNKIICSGLF